MRKSGLYALLIGSILGSIVGALFACSKGTSQSNTPDGGLPDPVFPQVDFSKLDDGYDWKYTETRPPCASHVATKQVFFGDVHSHTGFSFDAWAYGNRTDPAAAYRYARGQAIPFEDGTTTVQIARPLDFAAVSDHAEFLGEIAVCTDPSQAGYSSDLCKSYREDPVNGTMLFGSECVAQGIPRLHVCGDATDCVAPKIKDRWQAIVQAAEDAYDKTDACTFTTFVTYEYTSTPDINNDHRLVIFRNATVPEVPASHYEAPTEWHLWASLMTNCLTAKSGCDVMTEAHNTNLSSGEMYAPRDESNRTHDELVYRAQIRSYLEPLFEIHQHKGNTECRNGLGTTASDPDCEFEQQWPADATDCGESIGHLGMRLVGCASKYDYARGIFLAGLTQERTLGLNPFLMGFIANSDTHNGTPGRTDEFDYGGHVGTVDDTVTKRFGASTATHDTFINNPGGLTAVWAEENSRDSIFSALRRREVYATSGTRMRLRLFGGWSYASDMAANEGWEADAYAGGVPMGARLPAAPQAGTSPVFLVWAEANPGSTGHDANLLEEAQIVKGWLGSDGTPHESVLSIAKSSLAGGSYDATTCGANKNGDSQFWKVWTDPSFDAAVPSFYYLRVFEAPSCRWSNFDCMRTTGSDKPSECGSLAPSQRERAWSSPIWYEPAK